MVSAQAFVPNYCVAKAGPGILTGMPPASWQVALLAHLCDSHTGAPMLKMLGGIFFLTFGIHSELIM